MFRDDKEELKCCRHCNSRRRQNLEDHLLVHCHNVVSRKGPWIGSLREKARGVATRGVFVKVGTKAINVLVDTSARGTYSEDRCSNKLIKKRDEICCYLST